MIVTFPGFLQNLSSRATPSILRVEPAPHQHSISNMLIRATKTGTAQDGSPRMTYRLARTHGMVNRSSKRPCRWQRHVVPVRITRPSMFVRPLHRMLSKPRSIWTWGYHHR